MSRQRKISKIGVLCGAALGVAMVAQGASAAYINWDFTVESGFSAWTGTSGIGSVAGTGTSGLSGTSTKLSWPDSYNASKRSSIETDGLVTGTVQTNGSSVSGASLTHTNKVISTEYTTLKTFTLKSKLTLTDPDENAPDQTLMLSFDGSFYETPNAEPCPGSGLDDPTACSDIFVLTSATAEHGLDDEGNLLFQQTFSYDGDDYGVQLAIAGIGYLGSANCFAAGAPHGNCIGMITPEDDTTEFTTLLSVTVPPKILTGVPGPSSLILLISGLALLGLGFATQRRQARKTAV